MDMTVWLRVGSGQWQNRQRNLRPLPFCLLMLWLAALPVHGEIYKWVDAEGKVHYGDRRPDKTPVEAVDADINTFEKQNYDFLPPAADPADPPRVVMYATSWCPYCRKARDYFRSRNIPYTEHDIEKDPAAHRRFKSLGGKGVPLILVGERQMSGFSGDRFEKLYKSRKVR